MNIILAVIKILLLNFSLNIVSLFRTPYPEYFSASDHRHYPPPCWLWLGFGDSPCPAFSHPLFSTLLPPPPGCAATDFPEHVSERSPFLEAGRYRVLCVDPRGYGRSRPPERDWPLNFYARDAEDLAIAMEVTSSVLIMVTVLPHYKNTPYKNKLHTGT